ncbi:MAG: hypothetical protein N4A35_10310 [Flavobacteriales bacterium]|nr:hypothetical protein [Flavobacteriales bacterium]
MQQINQLILKLDAFIRKYYKNRLIKGGIYSASLLAGFFILFILIEYVSQFDILGRSVLFYSYLFLALGVFIYYILIPLFNLYKIGNAISYEQAAKIVGNHFSDVKDKLINTLQLSENKANIPPAQLSLINASIDQRIQQLEPIPFNSAIDFSENKKYLKYLIIPFLIVGIIALWNVKIITTSTDRLIHYNQEIVAAAPFDFILLNEKLEVIQQEDYELKIKIKGAYIPNVVFININSRPQKLNKVTNTEFSYTFRNIQEDKTFHFTAESFESKAYHLKTIPNPSLMNFSVDLDFPNYTQQQDKTVENIGDLIVPEGTKIKWHFNTKNTEELALRFPDSLIQLKPLNNNEFHFYSPLFKNTNYTIITKNEFTIGKDSIAYYITAIKDQNPTIKMQESRDSVNPFIRYFNGSIADDYGFSQLQFKYRIVNEKTTSEYTKQNLAVTKTFNKETYFHFIDFTTLELEAGSKIEYFFQVWDNDAINGAKSSRTQTKIYTIPTKDELADKVDENKAKIKDELNSSLDEVEKLKKELDDIQKNLLEKQNPDWQDKNRIQQFLEHQESLQNKLENIQQQNELNNFEQNQLSEQEQEILEKQEQLNKLFDELMTDEMKKLYEELQKMMEEMNKDQLLNKLDEIEMNNEDILKELDRSLEQFKQLEFEEKLENITDRLDDLAKKQEELSEKTKNKEESNFELNKKQEQLNKAFDKIQQEMDELEKLNEELENKHDLGDTNEQEQSIEQDQQQSQEELGQKKNKKASKSQQSAAKKMQELAQKMSAMQAQQQQEQAEEDMQALKQLLENLITFSLEQETVMASLKQVNYKDPKYVKLGQQQRKLKDDAQLLEDSLFALSKRIVQLSPYINKEVNEMNASIEQSLSFISDRRTSQATAKQQYTMTSANNLALLFDEALQQMQAQQKSKMPGSGSCNKPGGSGQGSPSPQSMKNMQKKMEEQLQKMKDAMEKGKKPGGQKPGDKPGQKPGGKPGPDGMPGSGGQPSSKQFAQMAAQQAALRKQIQDLSKKMNEDGSGNGNGLKKIAKEMEKVEEDLINKRINAETIKRQQEITVRLLEHEKAQREQEYDKKRKSNEAKNQKFSNPTQYNEYKRKKEKEIELLKTIPPSLRPYYKNKVNEYFEKIEK